MNYKFYEDIPYTICSAVQRGYGREPSDIFQKGSLKGSAPIFTFLVFICFLLSLIGLFEMCLHK